MSSEAHENRLHFLLVPFMEQGHMIPMTDLARLLASRHILVTFATTPVNLSRIQSIADCSAALSLPIRFVPLPFPVAEAGFPDGCESIDLLPSHELMLPFLNSVSLLHHPLQAYLSGQSGWPDPSCLISDNLHHWTADIARSLDIPRLVFHGPSCFFLHCNLLLNQNRADLEAALEEEGSAMLQSLPYPIRITNREVNSVLRSDPDWSKYMETIQAVEESADGVLVNSFIELEPCYFKTYREAIGKPVWPVGPLSLYKEGAEAKAARGRASSIDNELLIRWLDEQVVGSVVYVSFGSVVRITTAQMVELGYGLEASGRPFIWVVKEEGEEEWVGELERRVEGRGVVIRGWAPQVMILGHAAVGGFVTHCGWNSTLEAVAAGVVVGTWPFLYDQFWNERLVVDVLKIGVEVGVDGMEMFGVENGEGVVVEVRRGEVEGFVERLMGGGEEGEERRKRAKELREKARMAMEERGSSWKGLQDLINYIFDRQTDRKKKKQRMKRVEGDL